MTATRIVSFLLVTDGNNELLTLAPWTKHIPVSTGEPSKEASCWRLQPRWETCRAGCPWKSRRPCHCWHSLECCGQLHCTKLLFFFFSLHFFTKFDISIMGTAFGCCCSFFFFFKRRFWIWSQRQCPSLNHTAQSLQGTRSSLPLPGAMWSMCYLATRFELNTIRV